MASPQLRQGIGGLWEERDDRGEQQLSQREALRVRVAVRVERSQRMVELGGSSRLAKRPNWGDVEVVDATNPSEGDWRFGGWVAACWRTGRLVERTSRSDAMALSRSFSSCKAAGEERSGSWSFQG